MLEPDGTLCSRCDHVLVRLVYGKTRRFDGFRPPRVQYGCEVVNLKPIKPHKLPAGFGGDYSGVHEICPTFVLMADEVVEYGDCGETVCRASAPFDGKGEGE